MSDLQAQGAPATVRAQKGETLRGLAARVLQDERAAELLAACNPGLQAGSAMTEGTPVRLPNRQQLNQWAQGRGIALGFDPARPAGTRQKRAWNRFQSGPRNATVNGGGPTAPPHAAITALLASETKGAQGPGLLTPSLLASESQLRDAVSERMQWLGVDTVLKAATQTELGTLNAHAATVAQALRNPNAAGALGRAVVQALAWQLGQDVQKEARRLLARAQQALAATAADATQGAALMSALRESDVESRVRMMVALTIPRAEATQASATLERWAPVRAGILAAAVRPAAERLNALVAGGISGPTAQALLPRVVPGLTPAAADALTLEALHLGTLAGRALKGAAAMQSVVVAAAPQARLTLDAATALCAFPAARAVVFSQRGVSLDASEFPPTEGSPAHLLDEAVLHASAGRAKVLPDALRTAWRAVEALGAPLAEVDASALGRGVGALLARVTAPSAGGADDIRKLRAGDLLAMSGAAAVRTQEGTETARSLVPLLSTLCALGRFPFAVGPAPASTRMELRRRVADGIRDHYAIPTSAPMDPPSPADVRAALLDVLANAAQCTTHHADAAARMARIKPLLDKEDLCRALAAGLAAQRFAFRREHLSPQGASLLAAAWLLDNARALPAPAAASAAILKVCHEEGGRLLDAVERQLLRTLG